jgi:putative oxidoreductase
MTLAAQAKAVADRLTPWAAVFLRLSVGYVFIRHGLAKVHTGIGGVAGFFGHLGIPLATPAAVVVIVVETVGAVCVVLGLATRWWAACMAVQMVVAISVAVVPAGRAPELEGLLLAGALALVGLGAGRLSLDRLFAGKR